MHQPLFLCACVVYTRASKKTTKKKDREHGGSSSSNGRTLSHCGVPAAPVDSGRHVWSRSANFSVGRLLSSAIASLSWVCVTTSCLLCFCVVCFVFVVCFCRFARARDTFVYVRLDGPGRPCPLARSPWREVSVQRVCLLLFFFQIRIRNGVCAYACGVVRVACVYLSFFCVVFFFADAVLGAITSFSVCVLNDRDCRCCCSFRRSLLWGAARSKTCFIARGWERGEGDWGIRNRGDTSTQVEDHIVSKHSQFGFWFCTEGLSHVFVRFSLVLRLTEIRLRSRTLPLWLGGNARTRNFTLRTGRCVKYTGERNKKKKRKQT